MKCVHDIVLDFCYFHTIFLLPSRCCLVRRVACLHIPSSWTSFPVDRQNLTKVYEEGSSSWPYCLILWASKHIHTTHSHSHMRYLHTHTKFLPWPFPSDICLILRPELKVMGSIPLGCPTLSLKLNLQYLDNYAPMKNLVENYMFSYTLHKCIYKCLFWCFHVMTMHMLAGIYIPCLTHTHTHTHTHNKILPVILHLFCLFTIGEHLHDSSI